MDNPFQQALELDAPGLGTDERDSDNPFRRALELPEREEAPPAPAPRRPAPQPAPELSPARAMPARPAPQGGTVWEEIAAMGPAIARGGAASIAGAAEGAGIAQAQRTERLMRDFDAIDRGEIPPSRLGAAETTVGLTDLTLVLGDLARYEKAAPEARKIIRAELMPKLDPRNTDLFNWGDELRKSAEGAFPPDPRFEGNFSQAVGQAIGSMAAFMAAGVGTGGLAALPMGISGGSAEQFRDALRSGASLEVALRSTNWGAAIGATEFIPIMRMLTRANRATGGGVRKALLRGAGAGGKGGTEEAVQESFASVANNLVASDVVQYDPERGTFRGTDQAAGAGFSAGALAGTIAYLLGGRRSTGEARRALEDAVKERQEPTLGEGGTAPPEGPTLDPAPGGTETPPSPPPAPPETPPAPPGTAATPPPPESPLAPAPGPETAPPAPPRGGQEPAPLPPVPGPDQLPHPPPRPVSPPSEVSTVHTVSGKRANVRPEIVELETLIASHDLAGAPNPAYPQALQPRDRSKGVSREQITNLASKMNPALLAPSPLASEGAPIVGPDNFVDSGNARTLAIRQLYESGNRAYHDWLQSQGYDLSGFRQPVLVQRRLDDMTPEERVAFNTEANVPSNLGRSASETAMADTKGIAPELVQTFQGGELTSAANRQFVRDFIRNVIPLTERATLYGDNNDLSQDGAQRIENALFAHAYGDSEMLSRLSEDRENNFRAIGTGMIDAAPAWAVMRASVADSPQFDITQDLIRAVRIVRMARDQKVPVADIINQSDAFHEAVGPGVSKIVRLFYNDAKMRQWAGAQRVTQRLRFYATQAPMAAQQSETIFGDAMPALTPLDILDQAVAEKGGHLTDDVVVAMASPSRTERPPLDPVREVPVVEAKSRYGHLAPRNARTQAHRDARRSILGTYRNEDTGWDIRITHDSIKESLSGDGSAVRAEIVASLPLLLRGALRVESHPDTKGRPDLPAVHRFYAPFDLDGRQNRVKLTVREDREGTRRHYAVDHAEIAKPDVYTAPRGGIAGQSPQVAKVLAPGTGRPTMTLGALLEGVNYEDGTPIFPAGPASPSSGPGSGGGRRADPFAEALKTKTGAGTANMGPPGAHNVGKRRTAWDPGVKRRAKPITREKALRDLTRALGFSIYQGRIRMRSPVQGFYRPRNEEIRLKKPADIETAIHEAAHLLDYRFGEIRRQWNPAKKTNAAVRDELRHLSYDQDKLFEGFAEFVRFWATQPDHAAAHAPVFSAWWEGFLDRHPKEGKAVRKFRAQARDWFDQSELDKMRAKIGDKGPVNAAVNGIWSRFRQSVLDDLHGIYAMERDVLGAIQPAGAYVASRITRGSVRLFMATLEKGVPVLRDDGSIGLEGPGLDQILKPVMSELANWKLYAVGRSARELKSQGREFLFTESELEAAASLDNPAFRKAFNQYQKWNNGILDFAQALGVIDPRQRAMWKRAEYLPFYRVATQIGAGGDRRGRPGEWGGIKALRGGMTNIRDPLENIQANAAMLIDMALKNRARQEVAKFARIKGGGKYLTQIATETRAVKVPKPEVERVIYQSLGIFMPEQIPLEARPVFDALISGLEPMTTFFLRNQPPKGTNVLTVYNDGEPSYYEVADPITLRSLSAFTRPHPGGVRRILGVARRLVQMGITLTPDFMSANIFRDTITGAVLSKNHSLPFVQSAKGFVARIRKDEDYWEFVANGGGFASFLVDEDAYRARIGAFYKKKGINPRNVILGLRSMALALETAAEAFEIATRIGEFKKAKARGKSSMEAAYEAREVSTDWAMRGDSQIVGSLYDTIIFLKAGMVSIDRVYRGVAHDTNRVHIMWKTALIAGLSMGLYALNKGNPLFDELENWDRDGHWHIFFPTEAYYEFIERHGRGPQTPEEAADLFIHIRLPKIWEIGAVASIAERTVEAIVSDEDIDTLDAIRGIFANLFGFEYVPAAFEPVYEQLLNKERFTDAPIVGRGQQDMQPWAQYRATTSETAKWLGRQLGVSPLRIEHLVLGYMNTWGRYGLTLMDAAFFDDAPDLRLDQMPVMRRFLRQHPSHRSRYVQEFYDMLAAATEARKTIHAMRRRRQPAEFQRLLESRDMAADDMLIRANEDFRELRGMRDSILSTNDVEELQRVAVEWRKETGPGFGEKLWRQAYQPDTWGDVGALKLLLRDALTARRNALARDVVETVKARQREAE